MAEIEGASFVPVMVTVKLRLIVWLSDCPSSAVTVRIAVPTALAAGRKLRTPVGLELVWRTVGLGTNAGLLEVALKVTVWVSLAAPELMPVRTTPRPRTWFSPASVRARHRRWR